MNNLLSDLACSLEPYVPGEQPKNMESLIKLNTNENPYPPAPAVLEAATACINNDLRLYPDPASMKMRNVIAQHEGLAIENVFIGNGSDEVLAFCFPAFFAGKKPLCYADITYSFYKVYAKLFAVDSNIVPLRQDYTIDVDAFAAADCGGAIIPNPNAPTGIALGLDEIERIVNATRGVVVIDEAYTRFGADSCVPLIKKYDNILIVRTLSKTHALAGMRLGYALASPALIDGLTRVKDSFNSYPIDRVAQAAGAAAIEAADYYDDVCNRICKTRDAFINNMLNIGCDVLPSNANFVFISPPDKDAVRLFTHLKENNILVRHFDSPRIRQWLRITIGSDAQMDEVFTVIKNLYV